MNPLRPLYVVLALSAAAFAPAVAQKPGEAIEEPRGVVVNDPGAFQGYTLFAPINSAWVELIDMQGRSVHRWKTELGPSGAVYLTDEGHLLRCGRLETNPRFRGGGIGGVLQRLDWNGDVLWEYRLADEYQTQHHDFEPLPNGNLFFIAWEMRDRSDLIEWGRDPAQCTEQGLWPDALIEIRPTPDGGEVVWEWHVWDHLIQDFDPEKTNYGSIPDHPELLDINFDHRERPPLTPAQRKEEEDLERQMRALGYVGGDEEEDEEKAAEIKQADWMHTNAVDYCPEYDLIAISSPRLSEILIIDHSTTTEEAAWHAGGRWGKGGDILYRWGNPLRYGLGDESEQQLWDQHNVEFLPVGPDGTLRVTVFNNGGGRYDGTSWSSADELVLPFDPERGFVRLPGEPFGPAEPSWSYSDPERFLSPFISGAQRLPNGNTLICSGVEGRVFEVTPDKQVVWDFENTFGGDLPNSPIGGNAPKRALFRVTRLAPDHPGLARLKP
ncbi:MAG TPA: aryl-sulfate sulfotransferase [Planctomycetota bacterium]|nr:aryl-sulfate sulfotransferase [Planctomycetota bacterium]